MRDLLHLGGRLFLIALIAGLALGATYYVTKEPIEAQTRLAVEAARAEVFEGTFAQDTQEKLPGSIKTLYMAKGDLNGYVMEVEAAGYGGIFTVTVGVTADGIITGVVVGDNSETPGLGKNAQKPEFAAQFAGKDGAVTVKQGGGASGNEIDALTGATITTQAVTTAVNEAREFALTIGGQK